MSFKTAQPPRTMGVYGALNRQCATCVLNSIRQALRLSILLLLLLLHWGFGEIPAGLIAADAASQE